MGFLKNRTVIGVICILLSLLICFGLTPLFNKGMSQKTEIMRVVKEIKVGDEITKDMVQVVEVGGFNLPENIIRTKDNVIGKYATSDLGIGDYILNTKLSDIPAAENAYLYNLDGSKQAISITIKSFANGLSGKLQSGDIVSVIAPDYRKQDETVIPLELKYVEVISVTASSGYDANTGEQGIEDERELPSTVTLLVTPEQGNILAELESDSKPHLSLVYRGTPENTRQFIDMQEEIIKELYSEEREEQEKTDEEVPEENKVEESKIEETTEGGVE
ncbi:pilus assembly protein CpaB [Tissierella praeacuta DSM 18095]|uniref:Pilus assembly protein CpaB n=1 Tax=Tissierella praeacuta DSM 18095 TaxID=1123404 RepID=A0A1M4UX17_9FIRM|nr:RcpC/CpaB family pilus assembly protein [Tissierella praeacuta]SHE61180.1 pilus assembly protein CpaB [Tissierella praeacuta DSM 18095]SUP02660.1 Flp pilus assembly protein CpaB [Tissierella praeacuta]